MTPDSGQRYCTAAYPGNRREKIRKKRNDILFSVYNGFLASATGRRCTGRCDFGSNPFKIKDDPDPRGSIHEKSIKKDSGHIRIGIFLSGTNLAKYWSTERIIKKIFDGPFSPKQWYTRCETMVHYCAK